MLIQIISVGKIKEPYIRRGVEEYTKRLRPYCRLEIAEVREEKIPENPSKKDLEQARECEADRIASALNRNCLVIALDVGGASWTSEGFARQLSEWELSGRNTLAFVIGSSAGLSDRLRDDADIILSLSPMTFTHQMARLLILEQVYRAFRICRGEPYHK